MELSNFTGRLERGEAFVRAKAALMETGSLTVHIKYTKARGRDVNGYYRWDDQRMVLAVKQRLRYPRDASYGVGTTPLASRRLGGLPYRLVWHEDRFDSPDDLLVFVAGHEFWHYLCHSGQRKRDHETKANCNGFSWLREFRKWTGPECAVEEIPPVPPRPDRDTVLSSTVLSGTVLSGTVLSEMVLSETVLRVAAQASRAIEASPAAVQPLLPRLFFRDAGAPRSGTVAGRSRSVRSVAATAIEAARQLLLFR